MKLAPSGRSDPGCAGPRPGVNQQDWASAAAMRRSEGSLFEQGSDHVGGGRFVHEVPLAECATQVL